MTVFYFVLLALGVTRLTEWGQEMMPWTQRAWFVSMTAGIFAALAPILVFDTIKFTTRSYLIWALGLWGASALLHAVESVLKEHKELAKSKWLTGTKNRRNPGW